MLRTLKQPILLAAIGLLLAISLVGCKPGDPGRSTGAYPIDIFQEMHYNQSLKAQEPPRFSPPSDSYPVSGGFIPVDEMGSIESLKFPGKVTPNTIEHAALLYRQNCSMCHGLLAGGDGPVGDRLNDYTGVRPPAFDSDRVSTLSEGQLFVSLAKGQGRMPAFRGLLSVEDRWDLVAFVQMDAAKRTQALEQVNAKPENVRTLRLLSLRSLR